MSNYGLTQIGLFSSSPPPPLSPPPPPPPMARQPVSDPGLLNEVDIPLSIYPWMEFRNNKHSPKVSHIESKSV